MIKHALTAFGLVGVTAQATVTAINLFYHWRPDRSYELSGLGPGERVLTIAEMPPPDRPSSPDQSAEGQPSDQDRSRPDCDRPVDTLHGSRRFVERADSLARHVQLHLAGHRRHSTTARMSGTASRMGSKISG